MLNNENAKLLINIQKYLIDNGWNHWYFSIFSMKDLYTKHKERFRREVNPIPSDQHVFCFELYGPDEEKECVYCLVIPDQGPFSIDELKKLAELDNTMQHPFVWIVTRLDKWHWEDRCISVPPFSMSTIPIIADM